jgi:hypothetical protein
VKATLTTPALDLSNGSYSQIIDQGNLVPGSQTSRSLRRFGSEYFLYRVELFFGQIEQGQTPSD